MQLDKCRELYKYCQSLSPKVKRNAIIDKIKELSNENLIAMKTSLDTTVVRGYFLSASNVEHPFVKKNGRNVVVLARDLNECWERFVNVKEAMHLLDSPDAFTDDEDKFELLLNEFVSPSGGQSELLMSEAMAMWMALFCFCPEKDRLALGTLREKRQIDDYGIALKLKIPEFYVPMLFGQQYPKVLEMVIGKAVI